MTQLTKHDPQVRWESRTYRDFPVINHHGTDYRIVPESVLSKFKNREDSFFWMAIGCGCVAIAAVTHLVMNAITPAPTIATPSPQIIEKPVIVTQEKVVPTNCFAFCK